MAEADGPKGSQPFSTRRLHIILRVALVVWAISWLMIFAGTAHPGTGHPGSGPRTPVQWAGLVLWWGAGLAALISWRLLRRRRDRTG